MRGHFSAKSDVYSFGVLLLEIISSKKNSSFYESGQTEDLPSYVSVNDYHIGLFLLFSIYIQYLITVLHELIQAWKLWRDGTPLELMNAKIGNFNARNEVIRCIHIGLLCVQEDPEDRPSMASVVLMLSSYSVTLPLPQQPAFFIQSGGPSDFPINGLESDQSASKSTPWSVNDTSITELHPR